MQIEEKEIYSEFQKRGCDYIGG